MIRYKFSIQSILILGVTSSIARACSEILASRQCKLFLASRNSAELERIASDLRIRFSIEVEYAFFDITQIDSHTVFFEKLIEKMGVIDGLIMAVAWVDKFEYRKVIVTNFTGPVSFFGIFC